MSKIRITNHQPKTLVWWYGRRESIDFDPPYQRKGRLWSERDKAYLIDSIINGFDIPKLYLADFQFGNSGLNEKRLPYAIIDGKQRLEAVFDFFEGKLTLNHDFIFKEDPTLKIGGLALKDLRSRFRGIADEFENASFDVMSVYSDNEEDINELFVRLNKSKSLTGAEVRNAITGPVTDLIRTLSQHLIFTHTIKFSTKRAGDQNAAGKILLFEYEDELVSTKKSNLDEFAKNKKIDRALLELSARRALDTLDSMTDVFLPSDQLLASSGMFPVYYWLVRAINERYHDDIRPFLVEFERERKNHRETQKELEAEVEVDQKYARYDTLNRSTNDLGSHKGRFEILRAGFVEYVEEHYDGPFKDLFD